MVAQYVNSLLGMNVKECSSPAGTHFMPARATHYRADIMNGALLVVDVSLTPVTIHRSFVQIRRVQI
jgi:muramoyltetrapeptide carboxypeptidase LdcA involved in peptidoglycan recycling